MKLAQAVCSIWVLVFATLGCGRWTYDPDGIVEEWVSSGAFARHGDLGNLTESDAEELADARVAYYALPINRQIDTLIATIPISPNNPLLFELLDMSIQTDWWEREDREGFMHYKSWYIVNVEGGREFWRDTESGQKLKEISDQIIRGYTGPCIWQMRINNIFAYCYSDEMRDRWRAVACSQENNDFWRRLFGQSEPPPRVQEPE